MSSATVVVSVAADEASTVVVTSGVVVSSATVVVSAAADVASTVIVTA